MKELLKSSKRLLALFLFLPITPSIAAITVFTKSVLIDWTHQSSNLSHYTEKVK